jgi:membrane protein YdbS with pleckstrin-like domain
MSESQPAAGTLQAPAPGPVHWQKLPSRARGLFVGATATGFALSAAVAATVFCLSARPSSLGWLPPACAVAAAVFGAWLGWRRYRHTLWLLDADGFGLRRGRLWQSDTRVPGSRVQHLDIRRGPLERHFRLATLVIHTAGTRHSEVSVSGLDADDAERLRDHLARQTDDDDDASD